MGKAGMMIAVGAALALAGCNQTPTVAGGPDSVVINGVTYTKAGGAAQSAPFGAAPAPAPAMPGAPQAMPQTAPQAASAVTIPALGHWSSNNQGGDGDCRELANVSFNPTSITAYKPDGTIGEDHPVNYANVTPSSFTIYEGAGPGGRPLANVQMNGPSSLTMSKVGGMSGQTCTLFRR